MHSDFSLNKSLARVWQKFSKQIARVQMHIRVTMMGIFIICSIIDTRWDARAYVVFINVVVIKVALFYVVNGRFFKQYGVEGVTGEFRFYFFNVVYCLDSLCPSDSQYPTLET